MSNNISENINNCNYSYKEFKKWCEEREKDNDWCDLARDASRRVIASIDSKEEWMRDDFFYGYDAYMCKYHIVEPTDKRRLTGEEVKWTDAYGNVWIY